MRKLMYRAFFFAVIILSFIAGSWYSHQETFRKQAPGVTPQTEGTSSDDSESETNPMPKGAVEISSEKRQVIGVRISSAKKDPVIHPIRTLGRVAVDETKQYIINAATSGWVMDIAPVTPGSLVKKGDVLASFYAPELLGSQQSYLYGLNALDRLKERQDVTSAQIESTTVSLTQYRDGLRNLGMGDKQINEIARTRERAQRVDMVAPANGIIIFRNIFQGLKFVQGTEFFKIADLSRIWILVDVFENEGKYLKPGIEANVTLPGQGVTFNALVSNVLPLFDTTTRTLKVRLEAENPGYLLRPDMFVDVELPIQLHPVVIVPADAILDSGLKKTVFVDRGNGYFEPREVETGLRMGNRVEIVRGLEAGERIVTSGTFLIDSESKLQLAAQGMYTTLSKDPVCGTEVSQVKAEKSGRKIAYRGKTYYFDSDECKKKFQEDPERYAEKPEQGATPPQPTPPPKPIETKGHVHGHG